MMTEATQEEHCHAMRRKENSGAIGWVVRMSLLTTNWSMETCAAKD
jgi:hypothetical protein